MNEKEIRIVKKYGDIEVLEKERQPNYSPNVTIPIKIDIKNLEWELRGMYDFYYFQKQTGKPRLVRVKNPCEIYLGV